MLFLFRNIQFTTAISLAIYVVLLHLAALTGHLTQPPAMLDSGFVFDSLFGWTKDQPFWSAVGATALVYVQAMIVNSIADLLRLMNDRNWLPGMAYALLASSLPDFQFLSGPLVAATFVALAIRKVFLTYKSPKSAVLVFDSAFWLSVGSLFYPKTMLLLAPLFIGIGVMRSWNFRDQLAFVSGVFAPMFLGWLWYFWGDMGAAFRERQFGDLFGLFKFDLSFTPSFFAKTALVGILFLVFVAQYGSFARGKSMQGQKCVEVLYWVLFAGAATLFLRPEWRWEVLLTTVAPAGIFLAMTYQALRAPVAEGVHLALLGFVLLLQFFPPENWVF